MGPEGLAVSATEKPLWFEGMFLRPQHFQQYDRWIEKNLERRVSGIAVYAWGLQALKINPDALALGKLQLEEADVVFQDGTIYAAPSSQSLPAAIAVSPDHQGKTICLAIPMRNGGELEVAETAGATQRYTKKTTETQNNAQPDRPAAEIAVGELNVRLVVEGEQTDEMIALPFAQVENVDAQGQITLSKTYIPPVLRVSANLRMISIMEQIRGLLRNRAEALASNVAGETGASRAGLLDLTTLAIVNRYETAFDHLIASGLHTPEIVFRECIALIGEVSAYSAEGRRPPALPRYDHGDLRTTFDRLYMDIQKLLSVVTEQIAVAIPLEKRNYGIWLGQITDRMIFEGGRFVLIARADVALEQLRLQMPGRIKIGPVEKIRELVNLQLPGIAIEPMPVAPRQIPFIQNAVYFELHRNNDLWSQFETSSAIAVHVSGENPGIALELWAIREGQ